MLNFIITKVNNSGEVFFHVRRVHIARFWLTSPCFEGKIDSVFGWCKSKFVFGLFDMQQLLVRKRK